MSNSLVSALKALVASIRSLWKNLPDKRKAEIRDLLWKILKEHFIKKYEKAKADRAKADKKGEAAA